MIYKAAIYSSTLSFEQGCVIAVWATFGFGVASSLFNTRFSLMNISFPDLQSYRLPPCIAFCTALEIHRVNDK